MGTGILCFWLLGSLLIPTLLDPSATVSDSESPSNEHYRAGKGSLELWCSFFTSLTGGGIATLVPCNTLLYTPLSGEQKR